MANEIPVMQKMKQLNTARGRKGAWNRKNTTRWDRADNKARENQARERAQFVQDFIFTDTITIEDVDGSGKPYTFVLRQAVDDVLGVMALGRLIGPEPVVPVAFEPRGAVLRASIESMGLNR